MAAKPAFSMVKALFSFLPQRPRRDTEERLLVEDEVIVELKAVDELAPIHDAQLISYLKLSGRKVGLLINFNVVVLKDGITRKVL